MPQKYWVHRASVVGALQSFVSKVEILIMPDFWLIANFVNNNPPPLFFPLTFGFDSCFLK